jgi:hypothetical protein
MRQAMLHFHPLAQLRPPRPRRRSLSQPVLKGFVLRNAHRAAVSQDRRRALRPQGTVVTLGGRELDHTSGHQGLAEPDHVTDEYPPAFVQVVRRDFHRSHLELTELFIEIMRQTEFEEFITGLLREVIHHLNELIMIENFLFFKT